MKTEKILLYIILGVLAFNSFNKQCSPLNTREISKVSMVRDTIWQTKTDTFKVQTTAYKTVYIPKNNMSKTVNNLPNKTDATKFIKAKLYKDTLSNDDIDIYSYNLLEGNLLDSKLSYKLKVPREVTITKTIKHAKAFRSGLYLFSELGGNQTQLDNISLGLQYNRKGKWFVSYRTNISQLPKPTHHIGLGLRLFK